jgi:hypothetical protein
VPAQLGKRFTVYGDEQLERRIGELVQATGALVDASIPRAKYRAFILIGGYGRGEGGVEIRNGRQCPHNNLDFLLITQKCGTAESRRLKQTLDEKLAALEREYGIGIDVSTLALAKLRRSPCLVMFYDMRYGHTTVLGDPDLLPSLTRFSVERILPSDVRWLVVNRGSFRADSGRYWPLLGYDLRSLILLSIDVARGENPG